MKWYEIRRSTTRVLLTLASCVSMVTFLSCAGTTQKSGEVFSLGACVLAGQTDVVVSGFVGNEVSFEAEDFERNLNLSRVDSITICSLPSETAGELLLGSSRIAVGQTLGTGELSHMVFVAAEDSVTTASFSFTANESTVPVICCIRLMTSENDTPTLAMAPELSLNVATYKGYSLYGTLAAYDPDGDAMVFEIVSYPQNGSVRMLDREAGSYVYTPQGDFAGTDRFSYVARDAWGNYSTPRTVTVQVSLAGTGVTYADMLDSEAHTAALALTEAGIMSGAQVGNQHYFYPNETVTRAQFLVMAMNAAGITDVPACSDTGFFDDADIADSMKGYVATAYSLGYISGTNVRGEVCFLPDEAITRAQAAVMLDRILDTSRSAVSPTFADEDAIPVWAREAVYSLHAAGILSADDGCILATASITREQTARILDAVMRYVE